MFPQIFSKKEENSDLTDEEYKEEQEALKESFQYTWSSFILVDGISELTKHNWVYIFNEMFIIDFYTFTTYLINKRVDEKKQQDKILNKYRN